MLKKIGLIPARGGSKGIPRKNCVQVNGKPLIAYTIEVALNSELLDGVIVSTDDAEIAEIALSCGAQVPFTRPDCFASDNATDFDVINHFTDWAIQANIEIDLIAYLRPTTPLKTSEIIDQSLRKLMNDKVLTSVRSVTKSEGVYHPFWGIQRK